jgi:hypothetical protein
MSIRDQIRKLEGKELFCLESRCTGDDTVRTVFVSREVLDAVSEPFLGSRKNWLAEFRENLDAFLEGGEMSVGEDPFNKDANALIARVFPVEDEFWDMRSTAPKPGIRAFGGFAEFDTFICLTWEYRDAIGDYFDAEVDRCREEWRRLFGSTKPFKGNNLDAYLSRNFPV